MKKITLFFLKELNLIIETSASFETMFAISQVNATRKLDLCWIKIKNCSTLSYRKCKDNIQYILLLKYFGK